MKQDIKLKADTKMCVKCYGIGYLIGEKINYVHEYGMNSIAGVPDVCNICHGKGYLDWIEEIIVNED